MRTLIRLCLLIIAAFICSIIFSAPQSAFAQANCTVCISEFRVNGPAGGSDEFIELYNRSANSVDISGWKVNGSNNAGSAGLRATINANVTLQPRQHYLLTNNSASGYSLGAVATGDQNYTAGTTPDGGLALLDTGNVIQDQVGLSLGSAYKEGTNLANMNDGSTTAPGASNQFSYVRRIDLSTNKPQDTGDNFADFVLVVADTAQKILPAGFVIPNGGTGLGRYGTTRPVVLGAPGPENMSSPLESDANFTGVLYDNTKTAAQSPNRCYDSAAGGGTVGSLFIRRNVTNNSAPANQLRLRVVDITTASSNPSPVTGKAIIKPMTTNGAGSVNCPIPGGGSIQGTTLDAPSLADNGGLNSTLSTTPIPVGTSVNIEYRLAADRTGTFTYLFIYEAK
jgi:hypothetical protein